MYARKVEDLLVWQKARVFGDAVSAILARPVFGKNFKLRDQLDEASDSVLANIAEGFGQQSDKGFVRYLYYARSSALESASRLIRCRSRGYISGEEHERLAKDADEIVRMITGLIRYLERSDWPRRV